MGVPQNGCFIGENPVEMDHLGVPPSMETMVKNSWRRALPGLNFIFALLGHCSAFNLSTSGGPVAPQRQANNQPTPWQIVLTFNMRI